MVSGHESYADKQVLITGGLGFLGSTLAHSLVALGARVLLVDSMLPLYGGNQFNIETIKDRVQVNFSDIRDRSSLDYVVRNRDIVFHLAGQVSHVDSILDPFTDVDININGTLAVLEACRRYSPSAKVVFTGTRGQYGPAVRLPVDELAPTNPKGVYAISNLAAEKLVLMYNEVHGLRGTCLRITNTYGPRHQMKHNRYGVLNWFIRLALDNQPIPVFGDGHILRDYLYVDDAVEALLAAGVSDLANGTVLNVASGQAVSFLDLAQRIISVAGSGTWEFAPFTRERRDLEPGDFVADITRIRELLGWEPDVALNDGLARTIGYYRQHRAKYW